MYDNINFKNINFKKFTIDKLRDYPIKHRTEILNKYREFRKQEYNDYNISSKPFIKFPSV